MRARLRAQGSCLACWARGSQGLKGRHLHHATTAAAVLGDAALERALAELQRRREELRRTRAPRLSPELRARVREASSPPSLLFDKIDNRQC